MFIYEDSLSQPAQQQFLAGPAEEVSLGSSTRRTLSSSGGSLGDVSIGSAALPLPHKGVMVWRPPFDAYGRQFCCGEAYGSRPSEQQSTTPAPRSAELEQALRLVTAGAASGGATGTEAARVAVGYDNFTPKRVVTGYNHFNPKEIRYTVPSRAATPPFRHSVQAANFVMDSSQGSLGEDLTADMESLASKARSGRGVVRAHSVPTVIHATNRQGSATLENRPSVKPARTTTARRSPRSRSSSNMTTQGNGYGGPGLTSTSTSASSHSRARLSEKGCTPIARMRSSSNSKLTDSAPQTHRSAGGQSSISTARRSDRVSGMIFARARSPRDCRADLRRGKGAGAIFARALSPRDGRAQAGKPGVVIARALSPRECREMAAGGAGSNASRSHSLPARGPICHKARWATERLSSPRKEREVQLPHEKVVRRPSWESTSMNSERRGEHINL